MAQNIFHMLFLKICNRKFRYIVLGPSEQLNITTPLFFGIDLLTQSGIVRSNFCRIHSRYAKKGLATKIIFPNDFSLGGVPLCQTGAWFYSIQGVFQLIFEYQTRQLQLKLATALFDLWKGEQACPPLPEALHVTVDQFRGLRTATTRHSSISHLLKLCNMSIDVHHNTSSKYEVQSSDDNNESSGGDDGDRKKKGGRVLDPVPRYTVGGGGGDSVDSLWWLSTELSRRVESFARRCPLEDRYLVTALASFLKLIRTESKYRSKDGVFASFLELISNYSVLTRDMSKLRHFCSKWDEVDVKQNALLCLVGEWFGKRLHSFDRSIAARVDQFKEEHINCVEDLSPPDVVVADLFPECMILLVGHWIGMYGTPLLHHHDPQSSSSTSTSNRKSKQGNNNRADHSYFSSTDASSSSISSGNNNNNRADHSYSSSTPSGSVAVVDTGQPGGRRDHTYGAPHEMQGVEEECGVAPPTTTREDHTYVSTKDRRGGGGGVGKVTVDTGQMGGFREESWQEDEEFVLSKRLRLTNVSSATDVGDDDDNDDKVVPDTTKQLLVQLSLEFLNNVLISGVTHVVCSRVLRS